MEKEIWKDVFGFEKYYKISNSGLVLSKRKNKIMTFGDNGRGYLFVYLWSDNKIKKRFYIHRLVAIHFLSNTDNKLQVNHKDCNKKNNSLSNLEWVSSEENIKHAKNNKRFYASEYQKKKTSEANQGEKSHLSKLKKEDVVMIKKILKEKTKTHKEIAVLFNVTRSNIGAINRGLSWKSV